VAARIEGHGVPAATALACARLSLGDAGRAVELADGEGTALRVAAEAYARAVVASEAAVKRPWVDVLAAMRARGQATQSELEERATADLEMYPRKEHKRVATDWSERIRRSRRRVETAALDLALQLVSLRFADLAFLALDAEDLVRNGDRMSELAADAGADPCRLRTAIELVEDTRIRFQLNVSEELACEALAYRLEHTLRS